MDAEQVQPFVVTSNPRGTLVTLSGEFDILTVRAVRSQVDQLIATRPTNVELDMGALEFIDSSGIAMMLRIYNAVVKEGCGSLGVVNASDSARRIFDLCGLSEAFGLD